MKNSDKTIHPTVFPGFVYSDGSIEPPSVEGGITLREYFAARAIQGLLATEPESSVYIPELIAERAVKFADALLSELEKPEQPQ